MERGPLEVKNLFHVLPVLIPGTDKERYLYFKEHKPTGTAQVSDPNNRVIYVGNLHVGCTKDYLKEVFGSCGPIESIIFDSYEKDGHKLSMESSGFALITFESSKGVSNALKKLPPQTKRVMRPRDEKKEFGLNSWLQRHTKRRSTTHEAMQAQVDDFMRQYDRRVKEEAKEKEILANTPDEDGWTKVVRRGRKLAHETEGKGAAVGTATMSQEQLKKKYDEKMKEHSYASFYKFQKFHRKQLHLVELQQRFEEDKKRIAKLKEGRKFKPF